MDNRINTEIDILEDGYNDMVNRRDELAEIFPHHGNPISDPEGGESDSDDELNIDFSQIPVIVDCSDDESYIDPSDEQYNDKDIKTKKEIHKGIKILTWNIRSISIEKHWNNLLEITNNVAYDIIMLQEANNKNTDTLKKIQLYFPDHKYFYSLPSKKEDEIIKHGIITLIHKDIPSVRIASKYKNLESIINVIHLRDGFKIEVQNLYISHKCDWDGNVLSHEENAKLILGGDLNAAHTSWNNKRSCQRGRLLYNSLEIQNLRVINRKNTFSTCLNTNIDLIISSPDIAALTTHKVLTTRSDIHYPVTATFHLDTPITKDEFVPRFKTEKADWEKFYDILEHFMCNVHWDPEFDITKGTRLEENEINKIDISEMDMIKIMSMDAETIVEIMTDLTLKTAHKAIPVTKFHTKPQNHWFWNEKCKAGKNKINQLVHKRGKLLRKKKFRNQIEIAEINQRIKAAEQHFIQIMDDAKSEAWQKICESIHLVAKQNIGAAYRKIQHIKNQGRPGVRPREADPEAKAQEYIDHFTQRTYRENIDPLTRNLQMKLSTERLAKIDLAINTKDENDREISMEEIYESFKHSTSSAPGHDQITYSMLNKTGPAFKKVVHVLYNKVWIRKKLVKRWKKANVIAIPKPGSKERRPISLTEALGKNLERIAKKRVEAKIELDEKLFGFRAKRGTGDAIATTSQKIRTTFERHRIKFGNKKEWRRSTAVFLDLKRAFELANPEAVLCELIDLGIKGNLLAYIKDYLSDRTGTVTIQGHQSEEKSFELGTPQGGILSPTIFNALINSICKLEMPEGVFLYSYADDLIIISTGKNQKARINEALKKVNIQCQFLGLQINIDKSKVMIFGNKRRAPLITEEYFIGNEKLTIVNQYKYLGVYYTNRMNIGKQVDYMIKKANKRFGLLKYLTGFTWGISARNAVRYVNACIRPHLEYAACFTYQGWGAANFEKLETFYAKCIKYALGLPTRANVDCAYLEAGVEPMLNRIWKLTHNQIARISDYPGQHPMHEDMKKFLKRYDGTWTGTDHRTENVSCILMDAVLYNTTNDPHYIQTLMLKQNVKSNITYFERERFKSKMNIPSLVDGLAKDRLTLGQKSNEKIRFEELIKTHINSVIIFTDGSINKEMNEAYFAVYPTISNKKGKIEPLTEHILIGKNKPTLFPQGSTSMELKAILEGLIVAKDIIKIMPQYRNMLIVTDSKASLQGLYNNSSHANCRMQEEIYNELHKLYARDIEVHTLWVPSHIGILGNEKADELADLPRKNALTDIEYISLKTKVLPSITNLKAHMNKRVKEIWLKHLDTLDVDVLRISRLSNPDGVMPNFQGIYRKMQVQISWIRNNVLKRCSHGCANKCITCNVPFNTTHYLTACKLTQIYRDELYDSRDPDIKSMDQQTLTGLILFSQNNSRYEVLQQMLTETPPYVGCSNAEHRDKVWIPW